MVKNIENGIIYRITSPSGKKRVGYTTQSFKDRMRQYGYLVTPNNKIKHPMTDAIKKYGWDSFKKEIVIEGVKNFDLLCELEKHHIRLEASTFRTRGYNLEHGGVSGPRNFSSEIIKKMSDSQKERAINRIKDIIGLKYGKLTAIKFVKINRSALYLWKCDCGNEKEALLNFVKRGITSSCGCARKSNKLLSHKDFSGERFNRFYLERFVGFKDGKAAYLCKCDCGKSLQVKLHRLKSGHIKSCGCLKVERVGEKHHNSKVVLNKETGIFYFSVKDAAFSANILKHTLYDYLNKNRVNKTKFMYV